jgi:HEAT repeat protein
MADATSKRLLSFLAADQPADVRLAAAIVLGRLGARDPSISSALTTALDDAESAVRIAVMTAVGSLRIDQALPKLLSAVRQGGEEAEVAARAAAHLGAKGTHALQDMMNQVAPGLRRRIASALAAGGTASAETAAIDVLLDSDPGLVDTATRSLIERIPSFSPAHKRSLAEQVVKLLAPKKKKFFGRHSEAALVRLLAALGDRRAESIFWACCGPKQPAELRIAALQALGTLAPPTSADKHKQLIQAATESDFRIAAPALMVLKESAVNGRNTKEWLGLFDAADPAARRFAIEKLGALDQPAVAQALLNQLSHPDASVRDAALAALSHHRSGREALASALMSADTPDHAWNLARAQARFAREFTPALRAKLFAKAGEWLEKGDRRADALIFLLREIDAKVLRGQLEERGIALRKANKHAAALAYFKLRARDPACGDPIRFELAACSLHLAEKGLEPESRAADPTLEQFAGLLHRHEIDLLDCISKAKWLTPEDLFYLGFHFAEGTKEEREFAARVLKLLIERSPKSRQAKDARSKLKSHGLR